MRANLFVRTALKVAPAVFAAAIGLEPGMVWATTFVVTGDPGSAIEIDTYPEGPNGLAACRTRVLDGRFWRAETSCGVGSVPSAVQRRDLGRFGRLLCWRGDAWRPGQAGARTNIRFMFQAMVTRLHSPRTLSSPRSENWRNPSADLMMPNTGSGVCLRSA